MSEQPPKLEPKANQALDGLDAAKRRTLTKLALGAAFVTPVVASFSMDGLTISKVRAETADGSGFVKEKDDKEDKDKDHKKHHMHPNSTHTFHKKHHMHPNSTHTFPNSTHMYPNSR